jgi:hypothetical protein
MYKNTQILQVDSLKHKAQIYLLDQLQNPPGLQVTNSTNLALPSGNWFIELCVDL